MPYAIDPGDDLRKQLQRIAHAQTDKAIASLGNPGDDLVAAIHDCRKRCKMLRGLVRLVRPSMGKDYKLADAVFRDTARQLGGLRDAHALFRTFDALVEAQREHVPVSGLQPVYEALLRRSEDASGRARLDNEHLEIAREMLEAGKELIDGWKLDASGFNAVAGGLKKTYQQAHVALSTAQASPTSAHFHEYRKQTKYTWYHVRLLGEIAPSVTKPLRKRLQELSQDLGDQHDLAVLSELLLGHPENFGGRDEVAAALMVIDGRRASLQRRAVSLGVRLHAESPKAYAKRFEVYCCAWRPSNRLAS